jgi:hypothetical protein
MSKSHFSYLSWHTIESLNNLIDLYEAWNRPEKVEKMASRTGANLSF